LEQCGADSLYHDVGVGAVHPKRCYDATHPHGTRVNQVQASMEQMRGFYEMTRARGGIYGQELIFEQMLPYLDFYQCRANGGMLTHMEHTRLLPLLEDCRAEKLPLFEYVYGDLGAIRIDGYATPEADFGEGYYHDAAYTVLNGGVFEYNYENFPAGACPNADKHDETMMRFVGTLAQARRTYGKDFLVYGQMCRSPRVDAGRIAYPYVCHKSHPERGGADYHGLYTVDRVVTAAYRKDGSVAIFLCNVTAEALTVPLNVTPALQYSLQNGTARVLVDGVETEAFSFTDGGFEHTLTLPSRKVVMVILEA
jgi:hypothetical protein